MSVWGDHESGMCPSWHLDDEATEAIISGEPVDGPFEPLVAFVRQARQAGDGPYPEPSMELAAYFEGYPRAELGPVAPITLPAATSRARRAPSARRRHRPVAAVAAKVAGWGLALKIALGASVALGGVTAAGATGALPAPASNAVRAAIATVSPLDLRSSDEPDRFGDRVSTDATGESDGVGGVDGPDIARDAPGAEHRSPAADDALTGHAPASPDAAADPAPPIPVPSTVPDLPDAAEDAPPASGQGEGKGPANPSPGRP